jgi:hypothetical protein
MAGEGKYEYRQLAKKFSGEVDEMDLPWRRCFVVRTKIIVYNNENEVDGSYKCNYARVSQRVETLKKGERYDYNHGHCDPESTIHKQCRVV